MDFVCFVCAFKVVLAKSVTSCVFQQTMLVSCFTVLLLYERTNSDSALHQSTLTLAQKASFTGGSQDLQPKRGT